MNGNTTIIPSRSACARPATCASGSLTAARPSRSLPSASSTDRLNVSTKTLKELATAWLTRTPGRPRRRGRRSPRRAPPDHPGTRQEAREPGVHRRTRQRIKVESTEVLHRTQPKLAARLEKAVDNPTTPAKDLDALSRAFLNTEKGYRWDCRVPGWRGPTARADLRPRVSQHHEQQDGTPRLHRGAQVHRLRGSKAACKPCGGLHRLAVCLRR